MFGLLLRADQETAKRAIISGGSAKEKGRDRSRGGERERSPRGLAATSKVFAIRGGWKDRTTPLVLKLPSFASLLWRRVRVRTRIRANAGIQRTQTVGTRELAQLGRDVTTTSHVTVRYFQMSVECTRGRSHPFRDRGRTRSLLILRGRGGGGISDANAIRMFR